MRVKSAVDLPHKIFALVIGVILTVCCIIVPGIWGFVITAPVFAFMGWVYFGTYYELRRGYLYCRSGPFVERIRYSDIKSVRLCANLASSMALSRKRIEIKQHNKGYFTGTTYISPVNRKRFLNELFSHCDNLDSSDWRRWGGQIRG